jgi:hypothetical protein
VVATRDALDPQRHVVSTEESTLENEDGCVLRKALPDGTHEAFAVAGLTLAAARLIEVTTRASPKTDLAHDTVDGDRPLAARGQRTPQLRVDLTIVETTRAGPRRPNGSVAAIPKRHLEGGERCGLPGIERRRLRLG